MKKGSSMDRIWIDLSRVLRGFALVALFAGVVLTGCRSENPTDLIRSAREYQAKGDHSAAIIQLKNVLQKQPDNGEARLLLGQSSLVISDPATAEKEFRKALEFGQPRDLVVPLLVQAMLESGEVDKVVSEFGGVELQVPAANAELRARVGEAQIRMQRLSDAAGSFTAALAADPANLRAQLGRVRLLAFDGKFDEALAAADGIVAAHPTSADALMTQAQLKLVKGDRVAARAALERAVSANPGLANPRLELIALLLADGQYDAASEQITAARALRAGDLRLTYFEALVALGKKDYAKARELSQQLLKRNPDHVPTLIIAGGVELQEKQYGLAETHLQKALLQVPQHAGARSLLVRTYLASGQPSRALEALQPLLGKGVRVDAATMMLAGETYLANGDLKQASTAFEAASKSKGQESMARVRLGQIAIASGDVEGGVKELEGAITNEGAPIQTDMALITGYVRQGQSGKALEVAQGLVKKQPTNPLAYQVLGSVQLARKDNAAARAAFAKALELNPAYLPAAAGLARLDLADKKPAEARARFAAITAKDPKNELAWMGLAEVMANTKAPTAEIVTVLKRAIEAKPDLASARVGLVNLYLQEKDTRAALAAAQEASVALPRDPRVTDALGRAQLAAGETNQALETFNRMAASEPQSVVPLTRLASVYVSRKEPEKVVETLLRAQKLAPADVAIGRDLVLAYLMTGKVDEALKQAKALQAAAPKSAIGHMLEGDIYATTKQWPQAERAYREGLKNDASSDALAIKLHGVLVVAGKKAEADAVARRWMADHPADVAFRSYIAEQALRDRDFKTAITQYQAVIAQQPDNVAALNNLAWALGQQGDPKALGYAERALALAPDSPLVLDTIGVLLVSTGNAGKGVEYLARAMSLAPDRYDIRLNYAKGLLKAGRADEARKELTQLQAVSQEFPGKSEIAGLLKQ
jgi:putative PEP-CTERM system TPR-repeat lipoprotein